jgi:hypothetical protein
VEFPYPGKKAGKEISDSNHPELISSPINRDLSDKEDTN